MPNIVINIPSGVLDASSKKMLLKGINSVSVEVEQIGDDPKSRFLCWVLIEEIANGNWTCGGSDVTSERVPILVIVHIPAGVLNDAARVRYSDGVRRAVNAALPDEKRTIAVSCIFNEVGDGLWGVNGGIWHLKDLARHAGYKHLQHLVELNAP